MNTIVTRTIYTTVWPALKKTKEPRRSVQRYHTGGADTIVIARPVSVTTALAHFEVVPDAMLVIQLKGRRYFRFNKTNWPDIYNGEPLYIVASYVRRPQIRPGFKEPDFAHTVAKIKALRASIDHTLDATTYGVLHHQALQDLGGLP